MMKDFLNVEPKLSLNKTCENPRRVSLSISDKTHSKIKFYPAVSEDKIHLIKKYVIILSLDQSEIR